MHKYCIIHNNKGELSVHDNVEVPFTDKSEILLFRILKFFSGILNGLIFSGFGVGFGFLF